MNTSTNHNQAAASLLRELRDRDAETGLLTSVRIYRVLLGEIARSDRYGNPLSCMLLQIQGLKPAPADVRLRMTTRLADVMRNTDFAGVWDDEEFLLVLPETNEVGAQGFASKVERTIGNLARSLSKEERGDFRIETRVTTWQSGDDADAILNRLFTRTRV
jgi:GGDEF domain-containing protein